MGEVSRNGLMGQNLKVNGKIIKHMEKGNFGMWMEIFMKDNGKMICNL